ncbi:MAG TPA: hypothetical protein VK983_04555 [Candidatus Limnocylindrales bacterium]|nr:hypothetical protein [Candidatus Limnocylindrales bacterium]
MREVHRRDFKTRIPDTVLEIGRKGGHPQPIDMEAEAAETDASWSDDLLQEELEPKLGKAALQDPEV